MSPQLFELRQTLQPSENVISLIVTIAFDLGRIFRDTVEQVLDCPVRISEGSSEGSCAFLSREAHAHQTGYLSFVGLSWGLLGCFLLLLRLIFLLFFGFHWHRGFLFFNFGFGLWLLGDMRSTATWFIRTRKSFSLRPSFSIASSLEVVLPLKISFIVSAVNPLSASIFCLRVPIWIGASLRCHWVLLRMRTSLLWGSWDWFSCSNIQ